MSLDEFSDDPPRQPLPLSDAPILTPIPVQHDPAMEAEPPVPRLLPHLGQTLVLLLLVLCAMAMMLIGGSILLAVTGQSKAQVEGVFLQSNPFFILGFEILLYLLTLLIAWPLFSLWWQRGFLAGVYWNAAALRRSWWKLMLGGCTLSMTVAFSLNYLPVPKELPVQQFFQTPATLWTVALFGTLLAPFAEELFFRGFLLASLANAWEWCAVKWFHAPARTVDGAGHPDWSLPAMVFAALIASIGFAAVHSDQLDHAWAPLLLLYAVSLVLSAVRLRLRSLAASVLLHMSYNGTLFLVTFLTTDGFRHLDTIKG